MEPLTLIIGALTAGAASGAGQATSAAVGDAYQALRRLVASRFAGRPAAELALTEHETDPEVWQAPLAKQLTETGAATEPAIFEAAQQLMALLDAAGTRAGNYIVDLRAAQGVQVGDHNEQNNTFG